VARLHHEGGVYEGRPSETVLETLLRHGVDAPYSCRKGTCLTCVMRATGGVVPNEAQQGLKDTLRLEGYFLPCVCRPEDDLVVESPELDSLFVPASVAAVEHTTPDLARVLLEPEAPFGYRAGQFVNLRRPDGLVRSYSLASVPGLERVLELHVKRTENGEMSNWINDALEPGTKIDLQGPNGSCFYVPGKPEQPLLLIGTGSGLAPLARSLSGRRLAEARARAREFHLRSLPLGRVRRTGCARAGRACGTRRRGRARRAGGARGLASLHRGPAGNGAQREEESVSRGRGARRDSR
jgi:ferredoxin